MLGLLSDLPRKNCWTIAEWAGEATPDGMQHLLGRAKWDADLVRDEVCNYVVEHLHDDQAVLMVDETGDVKKSPPGPADLIPLTCNEIQRLFITLVVRPVHEVAHRLGWSRWRRRHQARAQASHYSRQAANQA